MNNISILGVDPMMTWYILLAYKRLTRPICIDENVQLDKKWLERKFAYFQCFGMSNTDISTSAMRSKMVETDNLKEVFPTIGASTFKLNPYRMELPQGNRYAGSLISVTMDSSKINQKF